MCPQSPSIIGRSPRTINIVKRYEFILTVGASAHLLGGTQKHTNLALANLLEQLLLLDFCVSLVDKTDFLGRDTTLYQLLSYVGVNRELFL